MTILFNFLEKRKKVFENGKVINSCYDGYFLKVVMELTKNYYIEVVSFLLENNYIIEK
jgi:hypothetical protein